MHEIPWFVKGYLKLGISQSVTFIIKCENWELDKALYSLPFTSIVWTMIRMMKGLPGLAPVLFVLIMEIL